MTRLRLWALIFHTDMIMQKLLLTMTLVAGAALVGCGKKEEAAPAAPAAPAAEAAMPELKVAIDASQLIVIACSSSICD